MPVLTKITVQKKNQSRYNLFIDGSYAFAVDEDVLIKYHLVKGKELSELDIVKIRHEDQVRKAYNAAIQFLSFRMRSASEIQSYLQRKDWDPSIIKVVIGELEKQQYINDLEFAKAFVRTYANSGKKGPLVLKQELQKKGVSGEHIIHAVKEYPEEKQIEDAIRLGNKYAEQNQKLSERMLKQKLEYMLATKGFPPHIVQSAMEAVDYEKGEEFEWETLCKEAEKAKRRYKKYTGYEYKQRIQQALYRKGFTSHLIKRYIGQDEPGGSTENGK
ncbi:recombination regulator RecX [Siminovitchia sediminis]|uniref:Regulatory protein RecX n=1 Tax=Siminovitchia sediminis TaxID=1274353 RepID=A0ABW4KK55_9BACI